MLLDFDTEVRSRGLHVSGVLHIGANLAQERDAYYNLGIRNVWWIEANPDLIPGLQETLQRYDGNHVVQALISDEARKDVSFHVSNYDSLSSSIYEFGTHAQTSPDTVWVEHRTMRSTTIDTLATQYDMTGVNALVMDIQGAEGPAIRGGQKFLNQIECIYTEVSCEEVYVGGTQWRELVLPLIDIGFRPASVLWTHAGWGDMMLVRK